MPAVVSVESLPKFLAKLLAMFFFLKMKVTLSTPAGTMPAPVLVLNCRPFKCWSLHVYSIIVDVVGAPLARPQA